MTRENKLDYQKEKERIFDEMTKENKEQEIIKQEVKSQCPKCRINYALCNCMEKAEGKTAGKEIKKLMNDLEAGKFKENKIGTTITSAEPVTDESVEKMFENKTLSNSGVTNYDDQIDYKSVYYPEDKVKEFILKLLTPNNISKGFVEVSTIKYHAGKELI